VKRVGVDPMVGPLPETEQPPFAAVVVVVAAVADAGGVRRSAVHAVHGVAPIPVVAPFSLRRGVGRLVGERAGPGLDVIGLLGNILRLLGKVVLGSGGSREGEDGGGREGGPDRRLAHEVSPCCTRSTHRPGIQRAKLGDCSGNERRSRSADRFPLTSRQRRDNITNGRNQALFSMIPRFDQRFNIGDFIGQGRRTDEESRSFTRLGGQFGVAITSDLKWLPVEPTVTETYPASLTGERPDLSCLTAVFSLYLDESKYFGVDLGTPAAGAKICCRARPTGPSGSARSSRLYRHSEGLCER
jgi:hypothetical protein